jgi:hypothetical protein
MIFLVPTIQHLLHFMVERTTGRRFGFFAPMICFQVFNGQFFRVSLVMKEDVSLDPI